ncbi:MAG: cell division protein CrgA [Actinomycetota bacterium]|nr:cell division protein CrgA [Actinomycetota bacterium]
MARSKKTSMRAPGGGGGRSKGAGRNVGASKRYTPPVPMSRKRSRPWVAVALFALLGLGVLVILLNYLIVLPGGASNWYLLLGLALMAGGFLMATRYR